MKIHSLRNLLSTLGVLLVASTAVAQETTTALPTAREVFDRFVEVTGADKMVQHEKRKIIGSFSIPAQGLSGNLTVWQMAPNLFYSEVELAGVGKIREGFDGTTAWSMDPLQGPQLITGEALQQKINQMNYYALLYRPEDIVEAKVVGVAEFEGEEAYELEVTRQGGDRSKEYFSVESGLALGGSVEIASPMGKFPARLVTDGYDMIGGVNMPTRVTTSTMGMQQVILTDDVTHEDFDASIFDLPAEIAAMAGGE